MKNKQVKKALIGAVSAGMLLATGCTTTANAGDTSASQIMLDTIIEKSLDETISEDIRKTSYNSSRVEKTYCLHQQSHQDKRLFSLETTVFVKVTCAEQAVDLESSPGGVYEGLTNLTSIPVKLKVEDNNGTYSVVDYQFPRDAPFYAEDVSKIFSSRAIESINSVRTSDDVYSQISEKAKL